MKTYRVTIRLAVESSLSAREVEDALREDGWPRLLGAALYPSAVTVHEDVLIQERAA